MGITKCITQPVGSNTTLFIDRCSILYKMNSNDMRKFLFKSKESGALDRVLSTRVDKEGNLLIRDRPDGLVVSQGNHYDVSNMSYIDSVQVGGTTVVVVYNRSGYIIYM